MYPNFTIFLSEGKRKDITKRKKEKRKGSEFGFPTKCHQCFVWSRVTRR